MTHTSDSASPRVVLKLLAGPQSGAEVPLVDGEYLIGSSDDCDIVLMDDSVAARHVLLGKQGEKLRVTAQDQAVAINDQELTSGESVDIPAGTVIGLGATCVGLGSPDTDWSSLRQPQRAFPFEQRTGDEVAAETRSETPESALLSALSGNADAAAQKSDRKQAPWLVASAVVLLMLGAAFFMYEDRQGDDQMVNQAVSDPVLDRARAIMADQGVTGVKVSEDGQGNVVLRGYVATGAGRRRLVETLAEAGIPVIAQIWADDVLLQTLQETLDRLGAARLEFDYRGQGVIRLHGFFDEDVTEQELIAILRQDVPAISRIDSDVRTLADSVADLRASLRNVGLGELITVVVAGDDKEILASGELQATQAPIWQEVKSTFTEITGGRPTLISHVKVSGDEPAEVVEASAPEPEPAAVFHPPLKLEVLGVVMGTGKTPYALLGNGLRVSKGDVVEDNYVVEAVEMNYVVVRSGSQKYVYYIGEGS